MRERHQLSIERIARKGFDFAAGDYVVCVPTPNPCDVTGATNETPIVIAAVNLLAENALVSISDVEGNEAANGVFRAHDVTGTHFALYTTGGSPVAGTGTYTEGGVVTRAPVSLLTIQWTDARRSAEGFEVAIAGVEDCEERILMFLKRYLVAEGVPIIEPSMYFTILGQRWDLVDGRPIVLEFGPNTAANPEVYLSVRKAIESASTISGTDMGYDLS